MEGAPRIRAKAGQGCVVALDVGGTKLAAGVVRVRDGAILARGRVATPATGDGEALFAVLVGLAREVLREAGTAPAGVGVGCGGPMRYPEGRVTPLNIPAWRDFPLRDRLAEVFGEPCIVDNDAKAVALGERWLGAGRGARNMLGMVVSTGVGGGVVLDGRLLHGERGNAGHIGHVVVWPDGPPCGCGGRGCVEGIASGSGLQRRVRLALAEGAAETRLGAESTGKDVVDAARRGDPLAARLIEDAGAAVGRGIASAAALLDLSIVTIGGSIALGGWDVLGPPLLAEVRRSARLDFTRDLAVVPAALGADAGLVGAAALLLQD